MDTARTDTKSTCQCRGIHVSSFLQTGEEASTKLASLKDSYRGIRHHLGPKTDGPIRSFCLHQTLLPALCTGYTVDSRDKREARKVAGGNRSLLIDSCGIQAGH